MSFGETLVALARRWHVLVAVLALAGWVVVRVGEIHPPYESRVELMLAYPPTVGTNNLFQNLRDTLVPTVELAARSVNTPEVAAQLRAAGLSPDYHVEIANTGSEEQPVHDRPLIHVIAVSPDPVVAGRTVADLVSRLHATLDRQQDTFEVPAAYRVSVQTENRPVLRPLSTRPRHAQAVLALLGVGLAVAAALTSTRVRVRAVVHPLRGGDRGPRGRPAQPTLT